MQQLRGNYLTWSQTFNPILVVNHFYNVELFSDFVFGTQIIVYGKIGMSCGIMTSNFKNVFYRR